MGSRIGVDLLGGVSVRADGCSLGPRDLGGTKSRHVLLALLLHRGAPVPKHKLVSMLWPGIPPQGAMGTLESYVCVLRKKLQPRDGAQPGPISTVAGCYRIDMARVDLDVVRYESLVGAALRPKISPEAALPRLRHALALAEAPLMPEEGDLDWLHDARTSHARAVRQDLVAAALKVAELSPADAERWAQRALDGDPLNESAWQAYLLSKAASGQHADGLRAYDQCRKLFARELGCEPGIALQDLYARLLRGASSDDVELSRLFDAVARLHSAKKAGTTVKLGDLGALAGGRRDMLAVAGSVEQAWHALDGLLRSSVIQEGPLARPIGA